MDERSRTAGQWLGVIGIVIVSLTFPAAGLGFVDSEIAQFRKDAQKHPDTIKEHAGEAEKIITDLIAQSDDSKIKKTVKEAQENPEAFLEIERAKARAFELQQEGKSDEAIAQWRSITRILEGTDKPDAARAWFSAGYLARANELRSKQLDERARMLNWWLEVISITITLLTLLVVALGVLGISQIYKIRKEAEENLDKTKEHARETKEHAEEAKAKLASVTPESSPSEIENVVRKAQENLKTLSEIEQAKARAFELQQKGKSDEAIAQWRSIARILEGTDKAGAALAWFSAGYLSQDKKEKPEEALTDYNQAIRLDPYLVAAYNNRGNAKSGLGHHEEAIADFDKAISLDPRFAGAYYNQGLAKSKLGRHKEAIADFKKAFNLAKEQKDHNLEKEILQTIQELGINLEE